MMISKIVFEINNNKIQGNKRYIMNIFVKINTHYLLIK
jgi:hypothetical protein